MGAIVSGRLMPVLGVVEGVGLVWPTTVAREPQCCVGGRKFCDSVTLDALSSRVVETSRRSACHRSVRPRESGPNRRNALVRQPA